MQMKSCFSETKKSHTVIKCLSLSCPFLVFLVMDIVQERLEDFDIHLSGENHNGSEHVS